MTSLLIVGRVLFDVKFVARPSIFVLPRRLETSAWFAIKPTPGAPFSATFRGCLTFCVSTVDPARRLWTGDVSEGNQLGGAC